MGRQWRRALALLRSAGLVEAHVKGRYLAARCLVEARALSPHFQALGFLKGYAVPGGSAYQMHAPCTWYVICSSNCIVKHKGTCRPCLQSLPAMSQQRSGGNTHAHRAKLRAPCAPDGARSACRSFGTTPRAARRRSGSGRSASPCWATGRAPTQTPWMCR